MDESPVTEIEAKANVDVESLMQTFDDILETGQMPDKSPFESLSDEEYKALVMSQFQDELQRLMKLQKPPRKATKKKLPTRKELKAKRKQSRRKGNKRK